nr:LemA family protein [uncultured Clostridium sp.]
MFRFLLSLILSGTVYYFTKNYWLTITVFILLIGFVFWLSQFDIVKKKEAISLAKGNLDDAFQKRYDILTKIYETTKGYINFKEHEIEVITNLFRNLDKPASGYKEKFKMQNQVQSILINNMGNLRDHQLGSQFETLNRSINEVEENLSASRRFYNFSVNEYNTAIKIFPTLIIAKIKGYQEMNYFEVEDESIKKSIEIKFN